MWTARVTSVPSKRTVTRELTLSFPSIFVCPSIANIFWMVVFALADFLLTVIESGEHCVTNPEKYGLRGPG